MDFLVRLRDSALHEPLIFHKIPQQVGHSPRCLLHPRAPSDLGAEFPGWVSLQLTWPPLFFLPGERNAAQRTEANGTGGMRQRAGLPGVLAWDLHPGSHGPHQGARLLQPRRTSSSSSSLSLQGHAEPGRGWASAPSGSQGSTVRQT